MRSNGRAGDDPDMTETYEPDPRRWQALALVCVAFFMTVLDGTIVTVALPSIKTSLHVSDSTLQWLLIAYTITFGGLLLLGGRAADLFGPAAAVHDRGHDLRRGISRLRTCQLD
jgi:MFS family permease